MSYELDVKNNRNVSMFSRDSYSSPIVPINTDGQQFRGFNSKYAWNPDLDTPEGLYKLANSAGLRDGATRAVQSAGGENGKFGSGGIFMDIMDILSTGSYGVAGLVKGKGFMEGVKNRESFSDEDSLGKYGWQGKIAGFALDIALDPLTWVAPTKILAKVPGLTRASQFAKTKAFGELKTINIEGQRLSTRVGGWSPLTGLTNKFVYGFAADPKFLSGYEEIVGRYDSAAAEADHIMGAFTNLDPEVMKSTLTRDASGRFKSTNLEELKVTLARQEGFDPEKLKAIEDVYKTRDEMMQKLVDLDVIPKETAEAHWETYLRQTYDEYLEAKGVTTNGRGVGIRSQGRKEGLTEEKMKELGQVEDPAVIWGTTLVKQIDLAKKAELQKFVAEKFSLAKDQLDEYVGNGGKLADLHAVPNAENYRRIGKEVDLKKSIGVLNKNIKKILKQRKIAFKDNKEVLSTIKKIEKEMDSLLSKTEDNLSDALSGVKNLLQEGGISAGPLKKKPTSAGQKVLAEKVSKFLQAGSKTDRIARETIPTKELLKEFLKTKEGIALEYAFEDPRAMYQWASKEEFFDAIRYPDRAKVLTEADSRLVELTPAQQDVKIKKSTEYAKRFGDLEHQKMILKGTNLKLIEDVVNKIEDELADKIFEKKNLLSALEENRMGQLAGKYVTKETWDMLKHTFEPSKEVGEAVVLKFKHVKVVWNPASHARNAVSAAIQNWWKLGIGPWRVDMYYDAVKEMKNNGKYYQMMKELGFNERNGYIRELVDNYIAGDVMKKTLGEQLGMPVAKAEKVLKRADKFFTNMYGHTDNIAKVAAFKYGLKKGLSKEEAMKKAYEATFNYAQVTPFVHQMRRAIWGVPFITFSLKAAPLVVSTALNAPGRISVFGKARNDLFKAAGVEAEQEQESMPEYMRDDMFMLRLPWKDDNGRSMYFDLSYIIPFGSIMTGEYAKNPFSVNPVLQTVKELSQNKTFAGNRIFNESDDHEQVIADITLHISKLAVPPAVANQFPDGYDYEGKRKLGSISKFATKDTQDMGPNERSFYQEAFKLAGFGVSPYDVESQQRRLAYKQKENLTKLLLENNIIQEFRNPYLPEDSELRGPQVNTNKDTKSF